MESNGVAFRYYLLGAIQGVFDLYLKKIYIQGFKSFADKTEIKFNNDITAIIGPNGSGKSNISDAIRWVLGEQSIKNLRGSKMEDVIFSGTDKRRPLGFAEVSIVFDNNDQQIPLDYNEVSITRRMFRSGESEFYINKNLCRLKDVRELLMDTGVGKEGYSIIGQGKIDEILSNKPIDRRGIFEEAAGIVKFKNKKLESQRKLDKTQNNILRIEDLIYEIENQRNQIQKEAKKTEKFNKLFIKLKELEVNQFVKDINRLKTELKKLNLEEEKLKKEIQALTLDKKEIESSYSKLKEEIKIKEEVIEESRNVKFATIQDFEKKKNQLSILEEKKNYLNNEIKRLDDYNISINEKLKSLESNKNINKKDLETVKLKVKESEDKYNLNDNNLELVRDRIKSMERELDNKKDNLLALYNRISDIKSERNSSVNFINTIENRINEIKEDKEDIGKTKETIASKLDALSNELQSLNTNIDKDKQGLIELTESYEKLHKEYEGLNEYLNSSKIKLNGLNSTFSLLSNMENDYDGYYNSVKRFMKALDKDNNLRIGLVGVVANLINVKDTYVKAIEISLGGSAQNLVVEKEKDAKNMIKYLKNNKIGRVTFLPKNTIKGYSLNLNNNIKDNYNILGLASELVDYDPSNENIIKYLLGRVIIIRDMDSAIRYSKVTNYKNRIVTLDGELFNPGGSITGGSVGDNRISILSRKNKLESLEKEIAAENTTITGLLSSREEIVISLKKSKVLKEDLEKTIENMKMDIVNRRNEIASSDSYIARLNEDFERKDKELVSLKSEYDNLLLNQDKSRDIIEKLEWEEVTLKDKIELKSNYLNAENEKLRILEEEQTDLKISINSLINDKKNLENQIIFLSKEEDRLEDTLNKNMKEIHKIKEELLIIDMKKEKMEEDQKNYGEEEDRLSEKLSELIKSKDELTKTFYEEQDSLKVINDRLSTLEKDSNSINVKIARYEVEQENIHNKLLEDYGLSLNQAIKYERDLSEHKNIKTTIRGLKDEIKSLGNVNINALEEFNAINERYEFMNKQYQDLIEAKENLKLVIRNMDKNMKSQFINNFEIINRNFKKVFSILFDGGYAELELIDEDNILESGIDIVVQPPGKKLQYLNLLSGGEKSLTAVALLFSILMTKPSPFCILDEIDAALDESNINRYITYLKNFNDSTQFILITHRKTTMEIADVLYGVTMEEQGVSKLISIKLNDEAAVS